MARKSKAKYKMKGHSISGIKGFKDTSLEDGRAASSAFQMKGSPLYEEKLGELDWKDEDYDVDPHKLPEHLKWKEQGDQEGLVWGLGEVGKAIRRKQWNKKNEEKKENETEGDKLDDQTTKYDGPVEGSNMDKDLSSKSTGIDYDALEIEEEEFAEPGGGDLGDLSKHVEEKEIGKEKTDYSGASKNEMTNIRRKFKDDGSWDPNKNLEHARIQNKINELYGSSKRY